MTGWRKVLGAIGVLGLLAVAAAVLVVRHGVFFRPAGHPVVGVDVSHHQGAIDWPSVQRSGVAFAYLKATEGSDWTDDRFLQNWQAARGAGLAVGAYHFFSFCSAGSAQAAHFLATVPRESNALPAALDIEFGGNCSRVPDRATLRREAFTWLQTVEAQSGQRPFVYVTANAFEAFFEAADFEAERGPLLWYRSLLFEPRLPWTVWQYHNRGRVDGVDTPVDLDAVAIDLATVRARAARGDAGVH